jgi:hypothetical protein
MKMKSPKSWRHGCRVFAEYVATIGIALLAAYMILGARW